MVKKGLILLVILLLATALVGGCRGEEGATMAQDGDTVKVHYTGTLDDGTVFDTSVGSDPLEFTLGEGSLIAGFENAVRGMRVGETKTVNIPSEEAYGPHRDDLVVVIDRDQLPEGLEPEVGQQLPMLSNGMPVLVTVTDVTATTITVDANPRLAGKDLTFEIEVVDIIR